MSDIGDMNAFNCSENEVIDRYSFIWNLMTLHANIYIHMYAGKN